MAFTAIVFNPQSPNIEICITKKKKKKERKKSSQETVHVETAFVGALYKVFLCREAGRGAVVTPL